MTFSTRRFRRDVVDATETRNVNAKELRRRILLVSLFFRLKFEFLGMNEYQNNLTSLVGA